MFCVESIVHSRKPLLSNVEGFTKDCAPLVPPDHKTHETMWQGELMPTPEMAIPAARVPSSTLATMSLVLEMPRVPPMKVTPDVALVCAGMQKWKSL